MDIQILSYNGTGFNIEKANFLKFLINSMKIDFFVLQEHMHLKANLYKIENEFHGFESFLLPAIRKNVDVRAGRPSCGLGIFWRKSLKNDVRMIKHPDSHRVQAIELFNKYVIINVYFPTDTNDLNDFELLKCTQDIKWYFNNYSNHNIIIAGDLNCDFSRHSRFVNIIRDFFIEVNLVTAWSRHNVDFTFYNHLVRNGNNTCSYSCIDHFVMQNNVLNNVSHAQVLHLGDNLSNHEPIFMSIKIDSTPSNLIEEPENSNSDRPVWSKASSNDINNYRRELQSNLSNFVMSDGVRCSNPTCTDSNHLQDLDNFYDFVTNSIDSSVKNNIPKAGNIKTSSKSVVPGWSEYVKPFRDDAKFWHAIWVSLGRPLNCEVYNVMKHTRNLFHYSVRKVKKNREKIEQDNMLVSFLDGKVTNLVKKLKKQRSNGKDKSPSLIDGHVGKVNIANHFASKYAALYNSHESSEETGKVVDDLNISANNMTEVDLVTPEIVYQAISCINVNTSDVCFEFKSNAILNAVDILTKYVTALLQSFLIHGYVPKNLIFCSLKPIIKDKLGDKLSSENYRAIGSSSLLLKVLDWVIFILYESNLKPSELQFGFQKKNSTTMCSWTVNETVNYYLNRDTPVFSCFLDLSKVFDLVSFSKLFSKLKNRIGAIFIRLLAFIYTFQSCCVDWAGSKSNLFNVSCGIRQGAVLSPILFSIYIDDLFNVLSCSGFGCHINNVFYGIVGYADDLVLLSPDLQGLQCMFDIAKSFLDKLGLKISVDRIKPLKSKTKCLAFGSKYDPAVFIKLDNFEIPWCDSYKHLGHTLHKNGSLKLDVDIKKRSFIGTFYELKQELKSQHPLVFMNLIMVYLSHFYGSNLWNLFDIEDICIAWNKIVRIVFKLPICTHRYLLEPYSGFTHVKTMLTNRFLKFYNTLYSSDKFVVSNLRMCQENDCRSTFGLNIRNICLLNETENILECKKHSVKYFPIPENEFWRVNVLRDLIELKASHFVEGFSNDELNEIVNCVASN